MTSTQPSRHGQGAATVHAPFAATTTPITLALAAALVVVFARSAAGLIHPPMARAQLAPGAVAIAPVDGMPMVYVPAGDFWMGSEGDPDAAADEAPRHRISLGAFWIDRTEVTRAMFARFVQATEYETVAEQLGGTHGFVGGEFNAIPGGSWRRPHGPDGPASPPDDHPVVAVGWRDATAYCQWAGRRLPTEAEWECAARGWDGLRYPWGEALVDGTRANLADRNAGLRWAHPEIDDGFAETAPVGHYPAGASPFGALDMAGNAWEWVGDWYDPAYYAASAAARDPRGPDGGDSRALRGGGYSDDAAHLRSARRSKDDLDYSSIDGGFRCALTALDHRAHLPIAQRFLVWRTPIPPTITPSPTPTPIPSATPTRTPTPNLPSPDPCAPVGGAFESTPVDRPPTDRPAAAHPDLNLAIRGFMPSDAPGVLVDINGPTDPHAPELVGLLGRLPWFVATYRVFHWDWASNRRGGPITEWGATLLGLAANPAEPVRVPSSGYDLGQGVEALVLYATDERVTLTYTRNDNVVKGYTVHLENVCVDPVLRALYDRNDREGRRVLPGLRAGQAFGRVRGTELRVAIRDSGSFMDPRSRKDWWPGLAHP